MKELRISALLGLASVVCCLLAAPILSQDNLNSVELVDKKQKRGQIKNSRDNTVGTLTIDYPEPTTNNNKLK